MSRSIASASAAVGPSGRLLGRSYTGFRGTTTAPALPFPWMGSTAARGGGQGPCGGAGLRTPGTMLAATPTGRPARPEPPVSVAIQGLALSAGTLSPAIPAATREVLGACPHDCPDTCSLV